MKPDFYTKAVLTVIAISLVVLCFERNVPQVNAAAPQPVTIVGVSHVLPVGVHYLAANGDYVAVSSTSSPLPVRTSH